MMVVPVGEDALLVPVQGLQDANPGVQQRPATLGRHDQHFDGRLPLLMLLVVLRQLNDVVGRLLEGDECATVRQQDWVLDWSAPAILRALL